MSNTTQVPSSQADLLDLARLATDLHTIIAAITQQPEKRLSKTRIAGRFIGGKVAGVTAMSAFYSAVATFGTASTGTAIGSLSGAAATNATLYWIGGLLGGGVAAGATVMTFGAAAIGAGAIMAWTKYFGTKRRGLDDLSLQEKRILCSCDIILRSLETPGKTSAGGAAIELEAERRFFSDYAINPLLEALASVLFSTEGEARSKQKLTRKHRRVLQKAYERLSEWYRSFSKTYPKKPTFKKAEGKQSLLSFFTFWKRLFKRGELDPGTPTTEALSLASSAIFITLESILEHPTRSLNFEQELVLKAMKSSSPDLQAANFTALAQKIKALQPNDLRNLVSGVKNELHDLIISQREANGSGDAYSHGNAPLRLPGWDVEYVLEGTRVKRARVVSHIRPDLVHEHLGRYPHVAIVASERTVSLVDGIQSNGFKTYVANFKVVERLVEFKSDGFIESVSDQLLSSAYVVAAVTVHSLLVEKKAQEQALNDALVITGIFAGGSFFTNWVSDLFGVT